MGKQSRQRREKRQKTIELDQEYTSAQPCSVEWEGHQIEARLISSNGEAANVVARIKDVPQSMLDQLMVNKHKYIYGRVPVHQVTMSEINS